MESISQSLQDQISELLKPHRVCLVTPCGSEQLHSDMWEIVRHVCGTESVERLPGREQAACQGGEHFQLHRGLLHPHSRSHKDCVGDRQADSVFQRMAC
ncbi:unnamed protein product [Pleuronectes platessa]|uniref:Uncharacterized protein n=1 Tax=Pleuronectes platessa TaxID=8262 RepID=A0A9N7TNV3_PLEPL|nr:unnamed protein product [Pleuronectes platessa]